MCSRSEWLQGADCVEKLRNSGIDFFRQRPIISRSRMRLFLRRREMAQELRMANLADPLATKFWSPCMARDFTYPALNPSFSTQSAHCDRCCSRRNSSGMADCGPSLQVRTGQDKSEYRTFAAVAKLSDNLPILIFSLEIYE